MTGEKPLHLVYQENYERRRDVVDRAARIDKLTPDRSHWEAMAPYFYADASPEMLRYEPRLVRIRQETTEQEKLDARRRLAGTMDWNFVDWLWRVAD